MELASTERSAVPAGRALSIALWSSQLALAAIYAMAGSVKAFMPVDALFKMGMLWAPEAPVWLIRGIGIAELAGAVGVLLPALLRIQPGLTPLAAMGLSVIQVLAVLLHSARGEWTVIPVNIVLFALSAFVWWGRSRRAIIS